MVHFKKIGCMFLCAAILLSLAACHKHIPGPAATCTAAQVCTECGKVLQKELGHAPGDAATCTEPQVCTRCGETLAEPLGHVPGKEATCTEPQICTRCEQVITLATGHQVGGDGVCLVCGESVAPSPAKYTAPGGGKSPAEAFAGLVAETQNSDHYHPSGTPYTKNAVMVCGDYGMEYFKPSKSGNQAYAEVLNAFAKKHSKVKVTSLIVPKCCTFETPAGADDPLENTKAFIAATYDMMDDRIKKADAIGEMEKHAGEYMFYRTDHHWTSLGAYYASVAYCKANGIKPYALDTYEVVVNTGFVGSLYGYAGSPAALKSNPDYTVGHFPHVGYTMRYQRGGSWFGGTAIDPSAKGYAGMYICGDQPVTVFESDRKNGKSLILFKESYGNAFVPYMIDYYERVVVIDIRKETDSVAALINRYHITDALIINNIQAAVSFSGTLREKVLS